MAVDMSRAVDSNVSLGKSRLCLSQVARRAFVRSPDTPPAYMRYPQAQPMTAKIARVVGSGTVDGVSS